MWSDVSARRLLVQIGTWERLGTGATFSVVLDTRGSPDFDRIIEISGRECVVEKLRDGFLGHFIGRRDWRRLDRRSLACAVPPGWFGFVVLTGTAGAPHPDRSPNDGRYIGLESAALPRPPRREAGPAMSEGRRTASGAGRIALAAIAARRGLRGYSEVVQEAIDAYLAEAGGADLDALLSLRGSLTAEEANALERRIGEAWSTWPIDS